MHKFSILSNPKYLAKIRNNIEKISRKTGFSKETASKIVLAADEACTNIIRHSYKEIYTKKIGIKIFSSPKNILKIIIRDYGIKPDLKKITGRRPKKLKPGGLGVYFIKKIMDIVVYDTSKKKGTELTLIKYADNKNNK